MCASLRVLLASLRKKQMHLKTISFQEKVNIHATLILLSKFYLNDLPPRIFAKMLFSTQMHWSTFGKVCVFWVNPPQHVSMHSQNPPVFFPCPRLPNRIFCPKNIPTAILHRFFSRSAEKKRKPLFTENNKKLKKKLKKFLKFFLKCFSNIYTICKENIILYCTNDWW